MMKRLQAPVRQSHGTESNRSAGFRLQQDDSEGLSPSHDGAALLEVLMAVIVMGIGVLTVATLFPISVLRAVQATKLTNATIMRYNAEAQMNMFPRMIADPDNNNNPATLNAVGEHSGTNYLVDPLGFEVHQTLGTGWEGDFANLGGVLPRFEFTATDEASAIALVGDPDSWNSYVEGIVTPVTSTPVTSVDMTGDLSAVSTGPGSRIILIDILGQNSALREITGVAGQTVSWANDLSNWVLGIDGQPGIAGVDDDGANGVDDIGELGWINSDDHMPTSARIELLEPTNFSWMLTVRNSGTSDIQVDVVVFYKRAPDMADEQPFPMARGGTLSEYVVNYAPTSRKRWKRGSYLIDPDSARWYRIQRVVEGNGQDTLTLDRAPAAAMTRAVFPRGIVDVYPLGNKAPL